MDILYLQSYSEWTAMTTVHAVLARALGPLGIRVHVAAPRSPTADVPGTLERLGAAGLPQIDAELLPSVHLSGGLLPLALDTAGTPLRLARLVRYVQKNHIQLIHVPSHARDLVCGALVARTSREPLVAHLHTRFSSWFSRPMRLGLKHADAVLAVSEFAARTAREAGVRPERLSVVPNAIDAAAAPPSSPSRDEVRASLGVPAGAPLVVTVARIVPQKGLDRLVGAFDIARKTAGEARLAVVGAEQPTDPDSLEFNASVRADIARRGLEGSIHFLGHRSDVAAILGAADVFAIASRDEAFGLVYLEAMMAGLPVVAEKSGGTPEVVVDGETGLLAPPDDVEAMGRGLAKLLGDAELSAKMGRAGKERAQRQFSVERTGELARDALERAVRDGPRWGLR